MLQCRKIGGRPSPRCGGDASAQQAVSFLLEEGVSKLAVEGCHGRASFSSGAPTLMHAGERRNLNDHGTEFDEIGRF